MVDSLENYRKQKVLAEKKRKRKIMVDRLLSTKIGYYSLSALLLGVLFVCLATFFQFKCNIYNYLNIGSDNTVCSSMDIIKGMHNKSYSEELLATPNNTNFCDGVSYVDYDDVKLYLEMSDKLMDLLNLAIKGDSVKYYELYLDAHAKNYKRREFFKEKIFKCFGGDKAIILAGEVGRRNTFIHKKMKELKNLAN